MSWIMTYIFIFVFLSHKKVSPKRQPSKESNYLEICNTILGEGGNKENIR